MASAGTGLTADFYCSDCKHAYSASTAVGYEEETVILYAMYSATEMHVIEKVMWVYDGWRHGPYSLKQPVRVVNGDTVSAQQKIQIGD